MAQSGKQIENAKLKSISKAKLIAEAKGNALKNAQSAKTIENVKAKSIAKAQAINAAKFHSLNVAKIENTIKNVKMKSIAKAEENAIKIGQRADKEKNNTLKNENNNPIISVFGKVNEVLSKTIDRVVDVAKEGILKTNNKKVKKEELKEMKEKEKKEQIKKVDEIAKDAVKEINNLTHIIITQSYSLIDELNKSN